MSDHLRTVIRKTLLDNSIRLFHVASGAHGVPPEAAAGRPKADAAP